MPAGSSSQLRAGMEELNDELEAVFGASLAAGDAGGQSQRAEAAVPAPGTLAIDGSLSASARASDAIARRLQTEGGAGDGELQAELAGLMRANAAVMAHVARILELTTRPAPAPRPASN